LHAFIDTFTDAMRDIETRIAAMESPIGATAIAVAYSGGLDSAVLLHLAQQYAGSRNIPLHAFHVHHGLSPNADAWLEHCRTRCASSAIPFDSRRVTLTKKEDGGVEEAARIARYAALGEMCLQHGVTLLLTAHHLDDQAETVLLQLLRGSGVAGLSGMEIANRAPDMLGSEKLAMARPLLAVSRADLEQYATRQHIAFVEDESNADPRYARNALRHQVMPALAASFPGFQQRFARSAQHAQAAQRLLSSMAEQDMASSKIGDALDVEQLKKLGADRADNLLRHWFALRGIRMPSVAWLLEMRTQLFEAKADAQLCVTHADCHIRRHRNRVYITPKFTDDPADIAPVRFMWQGESVVDFPSFHGSLYFDAVDDPTQAGIAVEFLQSKECVIRYRQGGERLKLAVNRPGRDLKHHYQAADIPAWERERLPLLSCGGKLLFAAGLGMDCRQFAPNGTARIRIRWQADPA
jgi:tRNA(Ile)-lysidine synthase